MKENVIACGECECFGMEETVKRDIRYKSGKSVREAVMTETESTDGHYSFARELG